MTKRRETEEQTELALEGITSKKEAQKYMSYMPSPFIAAALPARNVKGNVFVRKYNNITLRLTGGIKVPFGKYGRLLLTVLTTHAVITKNSRPNKPVRIQYKSLNELMKELQLPNSRCNDIKSQLEYFSNANFIYEEKVMKVTQKSLFKGFTDEDEELDDDVTATKVSTGVIPFIRSLQYIELEDRKGDKQNIAFDIVLDDTFTSFSRDHSVPINYTVYKGISSAVGKDIYAWLVYRNNSLKKGGYLFIPREQFVNQFMPAESKDQERTNWAYLKDQIKKIQSDYYPDLKVSFDPGNLGFTLYKSNPQIETNDTRYILITADI